MATIANPPSGFDFPLYADFSISSYPSDPLKSYTEDHEPGSAADANMGRNDQRAYFPTSEAEQHHHEVAPGATALQRPLEVPDGVYQPHLQPSMPYPFGQLVSSSSETVNSIQSAASSNTGSPHLQNFHPQGQFRPLVASPSSGAMSSSSNSNFVLESFDNPDYYQDLLAGDGSLGYVGEFENLSSSANRQQQQQQQQQQQLLAQNISLPFPSQLQQEDPSPFKKPHGAVPRASSVSTASATSPSEMSPIHGQGQWQNPWASHAALNRADSADPFVSPPFPAASPSSSTPSPQMSASVSDRQSWGQPSAAVLGQHFPQQEDHVGPSPLLDQEQPEAFVFQSPFFQQSSGIFVPPLESSYPQLLQQMVPPPPTAATPTFHGTHPGSPVPSHTSSIGPSRPKDSRTSSPYLHSQGQWHPYSTSPHLNSNFLPRHPSSRSATVEYEESSRERTRCPECGKPFRDLKAHMLTHQNERPEKCPITSCEYHKKGFSRKYDKNRHTLTHYKGTMVCGFCPHSGSAAEKSFNRADVFKRHLMTVHGVEQNPPNSRKKTSTAGRTDYNGDATGKCSICQGVFSSAQDFYEHLEDCVLSVVQKVDPSEAINEQLLTSVADDEDVKKTLERNHLPTAIDATGPSGFGSGDEDDDEVEVEIEEENFVPANTRSGRGNIKSKKDDAQPTNPRGVVSHIGSGAISKASSGGASGGRTSRGAGVTFSKGGVALLKQGRKRRKNYPISWGCSPEKMKMKKRVLTCWDGQRRLVKDDMMLANEFEVRLALPGASDNTYVTDLDVQTLRRADAFNAATDEERGPWEQFLTNAPDASFEQLMTS